MPWLRFRY